MYFQAIFCLFLCVNVILASNSSVKIETKLISSANNAALLVKTSNLRLQVIQENNQAFSTFSIPGEGIYSLPGKPILPAISRFVVVPPAAGLELIVTSEVTRRERTDHSPLIFNDSLYTSRDISPMDDNQLFPPVLAEMSSPIVIRGVRLVKVTTYPVQWDENDQSYIVHDHINADVRFTDEDPANPARVPQCSGNSVFYMEMYPTWQAEL